MSGGREQKAPASNAPEAAPQEHTTKDGTLVRNAAADLLARRYVASHHDDLKALVHDCKTLSEELNKEQMAFYQAQHTARSFADSSWHAAVESSEVGRMARRIVDLVNAEPLSRLATTIHAIPMEERWILSYAGQHGEIPRTLTQRAQERCFLAAATVGEQQAFSIDGTKAFDWISTDEEKAALGKAYSQTAGADRLAFLLKLSGPARAALKQAGFDVSLSQPMSTDDQGFSLFNLENTLLGSGGWSVDPVRVALQWNELDASLRQRILAAMWAEVAQPKSGWMTHNAFALTLIASPSERQPYLARMVVGVTGWLENNQPSDVLAPWVKRFRTEISAPQRAAVDHTLIAKAPDLARACGLNAPKPLYPPYHETDAVLRDVGQVTAPQTHHDHGHLDDGKGNLDLKKMRSPTLKDYAHKAYWLAKAEAARVARPELADAIRAYLHFLDATGTPLYFSYDHYAETDSGGALTVQRAIDDVTRGAVESSDRRGGQSDHFFVQSGAIGTGHHGYSGPCTENWLKAIGSHLLWVEGAVQVRRLASGERAFTVDMTLHAEDRYNFNPGAADIATGVPDSDNGVFEITGLGKEFMSLATLRRHITFTMPAGRGPAMPDGATLPEWRRATDRSVTKPKSSS